MTKTLTNKLKKLPTARQKRIDDCAKELMAYQTSRNLREVSNLPKSTAHQINGV